MFNDGTRCGLDHAAVGGNGMVRWRICRAALERPD